MVVLGLRGDVGVIDPAIAVAADSGPGLEESFCQFGILPQRWRDGEQADLDRETAKNIQPPPGAATAAELEHGFDERRTLSRFCAHADIVEHAFRPIVAVDERRFAAALDVEIEIHRDRGAPGPVRVGRELAIADEITRNHWIGFWLIHCRWLALRLTRAVAISPARQAVPGRDRSNRTSRFQSARASSCSRSRYAAPP